MMTSAKSFSLRNPTPTSTQDFARKLAEGDGFARRSQAASPKIWLMGDEDDFELLKAQA